MPVIRRPVAPMIFDTAITVLKDVGLNIPLTKKKGTDATKATEPEGTSQTEGEEPPPAFVLCIRGETFELGEALSAAASRHLDAAFSLLNSLFLIGHKGGCLVTKLVDTVK